MIVPEVELTVPWEGRGRPVIALDSSSLWTPSSGRARGRQLFVYTVESPGPGAQTRSGLV